MQSLLLLLHRSLWAPLILIALLSPALLSSTVSAENISEKGILLLDKDQKLSVIEVLQHLDKADENALSGATGFPKHEGQYWFAVNISSSLKQRKAIRLANAHFQEIELFLYSSNKLVFHEESGYQESTEGLHTLSVDWLSELPLEADTHYQLVLRVTSPIVSSLNVNLEDYQDSIITATARTGFLFFLVGVSVSLALHNLFFGASVRDISHILYAFHSLCGILFVISAYGLFKTVFGFYDYELHFYKPASVGVQLFGTWFCYVFFQVPRRLKELNWIFKALLIFYILLLMAYPFMSRESFSVVSAAPHPVFGALMILSAWLAYRRGLKPALYVFVGWVALIAGSTFPALVTLGLAPSFENILLVGLSCHVFEMYMLSLAISQKFRSIQLDNIAAKETDRSRSAFISYFSHEVKTPINGMLGLAKLLKQTPLNPQQNQYVEKINRSGNQLLQQLNSVLVLESGRQQQLKTQPTSLLDILDSSVALVQGICEEKKISLEYLIEPNVPTVVETDAELLQQLINNLVNNAAKYTDSGSINVLCSGHIDENEKMALSFKIKDSGIGIPYEDQERIFHSFTQASNNQSGNLVGTGMGLSIARNIAERLGGRIEFQSEPGKGSCFEFHLCVGVPKYINQLNKSLSVLIIDDIELNTEIIASQLNGAGHQTVTCTDPTQALKLANAQTFDAILLDIHMPVISGQDLMIQLRESGVECAIIGISAGLTPELNQQLKARGMGLLMDKPFSLPVFFSLVQRYEFGPLDDTSLQRYDIRFLNDIAQYKSPDELQDFFNRYHKNCVELFDELQRSIKQKKQTGSASSSHRLAGLCAALGLIDCANQAKRLQLHSENEKIDWGSITTSSELFQQRLQNALVWLDQQVRNKLKT